MAKKNIQTLVIIGALILLAVFVLPRLGLFQQVGTFSIIGDARRCGSAGEPHLTEENVPPGYYDCADAQCPSEACLIQVFTNAYVPLLEYKDEATYGVAGLTYNVQIYCCPHEECQSDTDCENWYGEGSTCMESFAKDDYIDYELSSWNSCSCSEPIACWYKESGVCNERTYCLNSCPTSFMGMKLYESVGACDGAVGNGNGVVEKVAYDIDDLKDMTSQTLGEALCNVPADCPQNSSCKAISTLIDDNDVTQIQMEEARKDFCDEQSIFAQWGKYNDVCILSGKEQYFRAQFGYCVKEEATGIIKFLKDIGRQIQITKDPLTDGIIVLVGGLLLFIIIFSRLSGVYGRFDYYVYE